MTHKLISFVVAEAPKLRVGTAVETKPIQSAPQYYESSMPKQFKIEEETMKVMDREIKFLIRGYRPDILLVEADVEVNDILSEETFNLREALIDACHKIVKNRGGKFDLSEEYSIAAISNYQGDPEQFLKNSEKIVEFLKSEKIPLDEKEIEYTISSQIKYAKNDLVIIDWDGAFVFEPSGNIEAVVDLFQLANLQLLRYRMLDFDLDNRLQKSAKFLQKRNSKLSLILSKETSQAFREIINIRSESITEADALERETKLIGDWYSARLYELIAKKFKLSEWQKTIQKKLESLEDVYSILVENFTVSRHQLLELAQIILFFVLQVGWFVLIILEFSFYTTR